MRSAFQNEQDEEIDRSGDRPDEVERLRADENPAAVPDRELTVSATTLLAVFFGLVLLCGLFFGLGYTFGRRAPADQALALPAAAAPSSFASQSKPSAAAQTASAVPTPASLPPDAPAPASAAPADESAAPQPETGASAETEAPPAPTSASDTSVQAPAGTMVQIAAVSNPADADVLVRALQQHGYTASAHRFPADSLIHVQIGPFANRADAVATKQKLLGDGYNAILK